MIPVTRWTNRPNSCVPSMVARTTTSVAAAILLAISPATAGLGAEDQPAAKAAQRQSPKAEWLDPDRSEPNGTKYKTFSSKVLGREVSYLVYLPPRYEHEKDRYPVIYWLHGMNGSQRTGAEGFIPHLDAAIRDHRLPPCIAVLPNGMVSGFYRDAANGQLPIESVIIKDLIPHVDQTYRTIPDRNGRVIQGYSMGGYGAAHLGFKYPELIGTVIVDAGALDRKRFGQYVDNAEHPDHWLAQNVDAVRHQQIRIGVGSRDYLLAANQELHELLDRMNIKHDFQIVPDVAHSGTAYYKALGMDGFEFHQKSLEASGNAKSATEKR